MSLASLGIVSGLASIPSSQRAHDAERVQHETTNQARATEAVENAAAAAGIGETEEDSQASDRDADGRRPWEINSADQKKSDQEGATSAAPPSLSKDPTGTRGNLLDLSG
jgi:hypothetical protein